ncbi:hypothetical protein DLK05_10015 [Ancylomarina longa]|uniref:Uncharacterized protein n=1 Tax=Ancylomarina longa TaxID=2487017 RepID=A0A434AUZ8_9BACT|nr:hypothetical protein DLK05_10015 [Ancylomarina longa]
MERVNSSIFIPFIDSAAIEANKRKRAYQLVEVRNTHKMDLPAFAEAQVNIGIALRASVGAQVKSGAIANTCAGAHPDISLCCAAVRRSKSRLIWLPAILRTSLQA